MSIKQRRGNTLLLFLTALKRMNLHSENQVGPLLAVDVQNNIDLHFRSHGLPLRCVKAPVVSLHYMSNEINDMAGGPHTVVIFNMWAHFTSFPLSYYANRVSQVRRAVVALLRRAPETKVIIKSANTGCQVSTLLLPHSLEYHSGQFRLTSKCVFPYVSVCVSLYE